MEDSDSSAENNQSVAGAGELTSVQETGLDDPGENLVDDVVLKNTFFEPPPSFELEMLGNQSREIQKNVLLIAQITRQAPNRSAFGIIFPRQYGSDVGT